MEITLHNRLRVLVDTVKASFWFVPGIMLAGTTGAAAVCLWLDARGHADALPDLLLYQGGLDGARAVLTTLGGSMISLTGVVFSLTLVALTLTANQFGPRLLRTFMRSTATQVTLGAFVCAFVYSFMVLSRVRDVEAGALVPRLSVNLGVALGLVNAGLLIYFIHHVAQGIHANRVAEVAAQDVEEAVRRMPARREDVARPVPGPAWPGGGVAVRAVRRGYILSIEEQALVKAAAARGWQVRLRRRAGDFVATGDRLLEIRPRAGEAVTEDEQRRVAGMVSVGRQRSLVQDLEAGVLQLTEIAVRSLSPGINDPFTAMCCVDYLGSIMRELCGREWAPEVLEDEGGVPRLWCDRSDFCGAMDAAFHQIRQQAIRSPGVLIRLQETMGVIAAGAGTEAQRAAVRRHVRLVLEAAEQHVEVDADLVEVRRRAEAAERRLSGD